MDLTLLITTFNRGHLLSRSLERLATLTPPSEIIVVDDGGDDDTEEVCRSWSGYHLPGAAYLPEIKYVYNDNPGPSICSLARNIGVRMASNEWIVTSEPELIYKTDVLAQFRELHPAHPNDVISAGRVWFLPGNEPAGDYTPPEGSQEAIGWVAPYTALWNKAWIEEVRGWDEDFPGSWGWDDIDLLTRLRILKGRGQHIDLAVEALHQFHGLGGDADFVNERHFFSKSFTHGQEKHTCSDACPKRVEDPTDLIANRDHEWGRLR